METLGSLMCRIMSFANKDILTSSFPVCIPIVSFSCLIVLAKTSRIISNRSEHPCLVPDVSRNVSRFSQFSKTLAGVWLYFTFVIFTMPPVPRDFLWFLS